LVLIEEPKGGRYYGGDIAAPVFSRVVSQALGILRVGPEEQRLPETLLASTSTEKIHYPEGVIPASVRSTVEPPPVLLPAEPPPSASDGVPSAIGLSARQALALFARNGLAAQIEGSGFVVAQDPAPGARVRTGSTCMLRLAESAAALASGLERRPEELTSPPPAP